MRRSSTLNSQNVALVDGRRLPGVDIFNLEQLSAAWRAASTGTTAYLVPGIVRAGIDIATCLLAGPGQNVLDEANALGRVGFGPCPASQYG